MTDPVNPPSNIMWLLRSIVTAEATIIIMFVGFFATGYQKFVTHDELKTIPYPYLREKAIISKHIRTSEQTMTEITKTLQRLNDRITKERNAVNLRITLLENRQKQSR